MILVVSLARNITMSQHHKAFCHTGKNAGKDIFPLQTKSALKVLIQAGKSGVSEIIFTDSEYNPKLTLILLVCVLFGKKTTLSWHDTKPHPGELKNILLHKVASTNARIAKRLLVFSQGQASHVTRRIRSKTTVVCLPILRLLRETGTQQSNSREDAIAILGNDAPYKAFGKLPSICDQMIGIEKIVQFSIRKGNFCNVHREGLSDEELLKELPQYKYLSLAYLEITQSQNIYWAAAAGNITIVSSAVKAELDFPFRVLLEDEVIIDGIEEKFFGLVFDFEQVVSKHDQIYTRYWSSQ